MLEIDGDCNFNHVYPALVNAIKAVEGKTMLARFPLENDIMLPVSKTYLTIGYCKLYHSLNTVFKCTPFFGSDDCSLIQYNTHR